MSPFLVVSVKFISLLYIFLIISLLGETNLPDNSFGTLGSSLCLFLFKSNINNL